MATFDQPALWNHVINHTGVEKVIYIGHSQGTTQMFAALSENPQFFKEKMKCFIALAPVLRVQNLKSQRLQSMK